MHGFHKAKNGTYDIDFVVRGVRVRRHTKITNRAEISKLVKNEKAKLTRDIEDGAIFVPGEEQPITLHVAVERYLRETNGSRKSNRIAAKCLSEMVAILGRTKLLASLSTADMLLVRERKSQQDRKPGFPQYGKVGPAQINKVAVVCPRALCRWARESWGLQFKKLPRWRGISLKEPGVRVRELSQEEITALSEVLRTADRNYVAPFLFLILTGLRRTEAIELRWSEVDLDRGTIRKRGKGDSNIYKVITPQVDQILRSRIGGDRRRVFTCAPSRPITLSGFDSWWQRVRAEAAINAPSLLSNRFRLHDCRHHYATNLLRQTGNLKLVQVELGHSKIETTTRYAHVMEADRRALGAKAEQTLPMFHLPQIGAR